ncbi:RNA-directed DNA polymerase, eukaryota, reverse transcriptase zinc-binding domain protein [Tanacetum coccineum]|uniref:RNA-directed DNA polymerase, eukaryota, reverse transcriptase zinc-binding domain protein n=1 Tax=Tanacetum coccineum TaxID=301880 RepID=A0ABQ4WVF9_9ASTR
MFGIDDNKALGPDGFTSKIFKKAWSVVGVDVCKAVKDFFLLKCITKIITNRIKGVLDKLVDLNQSAFISGRNITDNIMLTQELLKGYNRKVGGQRCAFKIDLQKAYDTGDPMSPYLFTLVMEVFNLILKKEIKESGNFKYHVGCKEMKITHLCFADDLLVLNNGDVQSVLIIIKALDILVNA